jgi:hypothetical protein
MSFPLGWSLAKTWEQDKSGDRDLISQYTCREQIVILAFSTGIYIHTDVKYILERRHGNTRALTWLRMCDLIDDI